MLSFLFRCFHFSYYVAALSPMLLLLLQYCCSSFNIAAPSSMLPLHLDVASPPSILTLQRVSEMRMVICRKEQSSWWPPPLMLPLFLWWIDVSANSQYYCSSVVVAAFPWMLQCPCKNELFSIAGPSNWSLHNRLAIPRPLVIPKKIELIPIPIPATVFGFNSNSNSKILVRINSNSNSNSGQV